MKTVWAKSFEKLWSEDKKFLKSVRPRLDIDWASGLPDPVRMGYVFARQPAAAEGKVTDAGVFVNKEAGMVCEDLARFYARSVRQPRILVQSLDDYVSSWEQFSKEEGRSAGNEESVFNDVLYFAHNNTVLVPDRMYLGIEMRGARMTPVPLAAIKKGAVHGIIRGTEWFDDLLHVAFAHTVSMAAYIGLRREEGIVYAGPGDKSVYEASLAEVMGYRYLTDSLAKSTKGARVTIVGRKLDRIWAKQDMIGLYRGIDALVDAEGALAATLQTPFFWPTSEYREGMQKLEVHEYVEGPQ